MRFVCDSCRAQYMISDEKVGPKGVKVRCKKCSYVILVKKADAQAKSPVTSVGADADDALATQVMQNPLTQNPAGPGETALDGTNPGFGDEKTQTAAGAAGGFFSGVDEDEIGAVFDQVLNSGAHSLPKDAAKPAKKEKEPAALGDDPDDRLSTRVLDAAVVNQLAKDSESDEGPISGESGNGTQPAPGEGATPEWFAAIEDKQTGPLSIERLRDHWNKGEIGPDSLAWKAGMPDWIPISEIAELASELSPRSSKPVLVAPTPAVSAPGAVVSMPVESAFSAGAGLSMSSRGEMQVPLGTGEEVSSWRPSAASALASLVKEEMDALSKPQVSRGLADAALESRGGNGNLIDLPMSDERPSGPARTNGHSDSAPSNGQSQSRGGGQNPYNSTPAATYSSPAIAQYRPPQKEKNPLIYVIGGIGGVALLLLAFIAFQTVNRPAAATQVAVVAPPVVAPTPAPVPVQPPVAVAPVAVNPAVPVAATPTPGPAPVAATPTPAPTPVAAAPRPTRANSGGSLGGVEKSEKPDRKSTKSDTKEEKPVAEPSSSKKPTEKDDFDDAFGTPPESKGSTKKATSKAKDEPEGQSEPKRSGGYIPPAPGQAAANIPESLSTSDVMEVVQANISSLKTCAAEQKKREPGVSGKLLMKWTIQTSGKTSNVSVASEEFKSTYMATCMGGLIKSWTFPKHKKQGDPVTFPFKF